MQDTLQRKVAFSSAKLAEVADFDCGDEDWSLALTAWLLEGDAIATMTNRGTDVWLYYNSDDDVVGFGSLGKTQRPWPRKGRRGTGPKVDVSIIPCVAVRKEFRGLPRPPAKTFAYQIMLDLIANARKHGTRVLLLDVDEGNDRAIAFYKKLSFIDTKYVRNGQLEMVHELA